MKNERKMLIVLGVLCFIAGISMIINSFIEKAAFLNVIFWVAMIIYWVVYIVFIYLSRKNRKNKNNDKKDF